MTRPESVPQPIRDTLTPEAQACFAVVIGRLERRIADLEARLNQNSTNSSRPPSTDPPGLKRKPPAPTGRRKRGGQPGHPKSEPAMVPPGKLASVTSCKPPACRRCRRPLQGEDPDPLVHQVAEWPVVEPVFHEYRRHCLRCPGCGETTCGVLPPGVTAGAFGPRLQATLGSLAVAYRLSKRQVQQLAKDLMGLRIAVGMIARLERHSAATLEAPVEQLRASVIEAPVVHVDEPPGIALLEPAFPHGYDAPATIAYSCRDECSEGIRMRIDLINNYKAQPRLFTAVFLGVLLWFLLPRDWRLSTRLLVAWDCSTGLYLILATLMMEGSKIDRIRHRAARQDEGAFVILGLTTVTALVSLAGIMAQLAAAKSQNGSGRWPHIALAGLTVVLSWTFTHAVFAIHYAHVYYGGQEDKPTGGLEFPGHDEPDYWDFIYYSFVIGTACATADVNLTSKIMRRITTVHCTVAFFFNTTILALTVNIGAGFF